jgi:regulator of protease activity HflC (stomatin/prohibitin superfamily)
MSDVRWMTYTEVAQALGIGPDSARNLVRRKHWPRQNGNDGLARIGVPVDHLKERTKPDSGFDTPISLPIDPPSDPAIDGGADGGSVVGVLNRHIERLEGQLATYTVKLAAAESEREIERLRADAERQKANDLAVQAATVQPLKETLQALKNALDADKSRTAELRQERDRWHQLATKPRGLFGWLKRTA